MVKKKNLKNIFDFLQKKKIIFFDCSIDYVNLNSLKNFFFSKSKIFYKIKINQINIQKTIKELTSLKKNIYCLMIHNIDHNSIKRLKKNYANLKILSKIIPKVKLGISIYDLKDLNLIKRSNLKFDYIQIPLNIFDNTFNKENTNDLRKKGFKFIARSIFLQGILLRSSKDQSIKKNFKIKLNKLDQFIYKHKISRLEICLDFIKKQKWINKTIIGIDDVHQLKNIIYKINIKKRIKYNYKFFTNEKKIIDPRIWN
jgi:aryl-alcohol dehydrogenase-like predicted oxidoreductase